MRFVALLLALVALAVAQDFQCSVQYRTPLMRNGVVRGTLKMSNAANARMLIEYPPTATRDVSFRELYTFNGANGYNGVNPLPYDGQYVFRTGSSCACETGFFDYALPALTTNYDVSSTVLRAAYTKGAAVNGCDVYTLKDNPATWAIPSTSPMANMAVSKIAMYLKEVSIDQSGFPCSAKTVKGDSYVFSDCRAATFEKATVFAEPSGCKCGKPIDVVLVLDRSGSISLTEFKDQKGFVTDFASQLDFGPLKANLAIINFQSKAWIHSSITEGISTQNVNKSINALGCTPDCDQTGRNCNGSPDACCCCCGTCISCGVRFGADEFPKGRSFAFKLLIVITDGYANHPSSNFPCSDNVNCDQDLKAGTDYAKSKAGANFAVYVVGVGSDRDVSSPQLITVADGKKERVLRRNNFAELATINLELVSRSCDQQETPCGNGCCGFCVCQKCLAPDTCDNPTPCSIATVPTGQFCCATTPVSCANETNTHKCHTWQCDDNPRSATAGKCIINKTIACGAPANPQCFERNCINSTGLCVTTKKANCTAKECVAANECDDGNACTTDECVGDGACQWTLINCSAKAGFTPDKCSTISCDTQTQGQREPCVRTPFPANYCDDGNNCTIDFCDPLLGCVHTNRTDCVDGKMCTLDTCDPANGCQFIPVVCNTKNVSACAVSSCNETTGLCEDRLVPCTGEFPALIVGASLGAAALVGIIIAAIICAAGVAGGAGYAYVQASGKGDLSNVNSNPLYQSAGNAGTNPLYKN